ncbi:MAG: hypothetical protein PUP92_04575 [Rhizonema sp. PD38]|nr:hypothetical protein [Rhizonema sp. PD38]
MSVHTFPRVWSDREPNGVLTILAKVLAFELAPLGNLLARRKQKNGGFAFAVSTELIDSFDFKFYQTSAIPSLKGSPVKGCTPILG